MKKKYLLVFLLFFFHISFAQQGNWFWGHEGIGDSYIGWSIASDRQGDCYIAGMFENDTIHFGSYTVLNSTVTSSPYSSNFDAFLVKYDHNGNVLWAKQTFEKNINNNLSGDSPESVCTDNFGNVFLGGNFIDTLYIGGYMLLAPNTGTNPQDMYLAKYASNGNLIWVRQAICFSDSSFINEEHISCDNRGNTYVTGIYWGTVKIGSNTLTAPSSSHTLFLAKYDSSGNVLWVKQPSDKSHDNISYGITTDKLENVFITGTFGDSLTFGSFTLHNIYNNSCFYIIKFDSNGNTLWGKQANIPSRYSSVDGVSLATDQYGNVYATGQFTDTIVFGHDTLNSSEGSFFLIKYDSSGSFIWAKQATPLDGNRWCAWTLSIDNSNHLYLCANGEGGNGQLSIIAFNKDTLSLKDTVKYDGPSVIYKLDSAANVLCSSIIPIGGDNNGPTVAVSDISGNYIYLEGMAKGFATFGQDTINPFAYRTNPIQHFNYFPFTARWQECDSNLLYAAVQSPRISDAEVKIYPNPSNGIFNLICHSAQSEEAQSILTIYNVLGEQVLAETLRSAQGDNTIDLSIQPNGIYLYRIISGNGNLMGEGKLVIQK